MSVKSAPFFWLECDKCGVKSTEDGDYAAWADKGGATEEAEASDWLIEEGRHLCEKCVTRCPECREVLAENGVCSDPECAPRCICGPDSTGEGPDTRPDCGPCNTRPHPTVVPEAPF